MPKMRYAGSLAIVIALAAAAPSAGQPNAVSVAEGLTLRQSLATLTGPTGGTAAGEALALGAMLDVTTTPLGISSGGFAFKVDPNTGLLVRTATTFGPTFAERVLTSGAGKVSVSTSLGVATYDRIGDLSLSRMTTSAATSATPALSRTGTTSLVMSSQTALMAASLGVTDRLDISVAIPMITIEVDGISWSEDPAGKVHVRTAAKGVGSGLGDVAVHGKFRLARFGAGEPDPGGLALLGTVRLPTGDRENLRGLGVTRVMTALAASAGRGRFRPHANAGFEVWSKGLTIPGANSSVEVRHQVQYAGGVEFEALPKLTLMVDLVGRHFLGGGRPDLQALAPGAAGVTGFQGLTVTDGRLHKVAVAPGLKWNLKGNMLLSLNALVPLRDNGVHDRFTPVIGLDWTF